MPLSRAYYKYVPTECQIHVKSRSLAADRRTRMDRPSSFSKGILHEAVSPCDGVRERRRPRHRRYATRIRRGGGSTPSSLVPIVPCRLMDTRPGADNVGPRSTPLQPGETYTTRGVGHQRCLHDPLDSATAVAANVTSVNGNATSYLTLFPADAAAPLASNLNWGPGCASDPEQDRRQALRSTASSRCSTWPARST